MSDMLIARIKRVMQDPKRRTSVSKWRGTPFYPPVSQAVVAAAEAQLGFPLPPLLKRLYLEVCNGGIGPSYGIGGLEGGYPFAFPWGDRTLVQFYRDMRGESEDVAAMMGFDPEELPEGEGIPEWPGHMLPIVDDGDWQLYCVDCTRADYPVLFYIGYEYKWEPRSPSLNQWLEEWVTAVEKADIPG